jgi:hypothetical protein
MQCFQDDGKNGFKLWYNNGVKFTWGTASNDVVSAGNREMIVIRHKKGINNLTIYKSNLSSLAEVGTVELTKTKETIGEGTLVFGASRADDGIYENYALGNIYWAKLWYVDLGEDVCKDLALWTHESISMSACGFRKYYLSENASKRCSFSLLANNLLGRLMSYNISSSTTGGWSTSTLNRFLNNRLYKAIPVQFRQLLKQVKVASSIGDKSIDVETSNCYITIPACIEVDSTMTTEPYLSEGTAISYMTTNASRQRARVGGEPEAYWLRSPNVTYANYIFTVNAAGEPFGYNYPTAKAGVLIEISI